MASEIAAASGYGSLAAFSRAFARAYGVPPSAFASSGPAVELDLTERMVSHHLDRVLERPLRPGFVAVSFEGEESSAALMAERLV